jgi:invasion protein IalB
LHFGQFGATFQDYRIDQMKFLRRLATSLATSSLAIALVLNAAPVEAQTAPAQQRPPQQRPQQQRPQQQAPGPKGPQGPQQVPPQNAGPVIVQVKAEPSQPEWTKVCGKDPSNKTELCYTTRDFVSDNGQRILAVALYDLPAQPSQKMLRVLMPLGMLVQPGFRFGVDKGQPAPGQYALCSPGGCFAEAKVKTDFITALKKGTTLNLSARNQGGREVTFAVPAAGFGKAFDGPPVDPQVLEERQKKAQEELQKRSDELRQRMMNNPAGPAQNPAANATPPAPKP